jgi:hypothetical protein
MYSKPLPPKADVPGEMRNGQATILPRSTIRVDERQSSQKFYV